MKAVGYEHYAAIRVKVTLVAPACRHKTHGIRVLLQHSPQLLLFHYSDPALFNVGSKVVMVVVHQHDVFVTAIVNDHEGLALRRKLYEQLLFSNVVQTDVDTSFSDLS